VDRAHLEDDVSSCGLGLRHSAVPSFMYLFSHPQVHSVMTVPLLQIVPYSRSKT
jgi:hypothetical protein